jgi:Ser/Thr protein kinase RdoA (MazF antagonist)
VSTSIEGLATLQKVIEQHYSLGNVHLPQVLEQAHQRRHRKLIVVTDAGRFLVKTYKRDPYILDALRFQHRLSAHLERHGLPVAAIQPSKTGKRIVEIEDWALELQQFVEGASLQQVSKPKLIASAEALGRFHEVCRDFPRPERDARVWRFSEVPRQSFRQLYDRARNEKAGQPEIDDHCNRIALFLRDAGEALNYEARNQFETGLIHGDWHGGNLIFRGDEIVAIVDLEFAGDGCYLEDLAYAMSSLCIRTTEKPDRLSTRTDLLLHFYRQHRSLSYFEEAALYYAVGVKHIATVSYQIEQREGAVAGLTAASWIERLAKQCGWLAARAQRARWGS